MPNQKKIAVFLGPSCSLNEAKEILPDADYLPPAIRGSIYNIINDGYDHILILDGIFYSEFSVWHKEILFALDSGINVIGASSMGALRAAELHNYGVMGIGTIFNWYKDGTIDGDDEVALLHRNAEDGYKGLSIPLVNLRWNLQRAVDQNIINSLEKDQILNYSKNMCFSERTIESTSGKLTCPQLAQKLIHWYRDNAEDIKKIDCLKSLKYVSTINSEDKSTTVTNPKLRPYEYVHSNMGIEYFLHERQVSINAKTADSTTPLLNYAEAVKIDTPEYQCYLRARSYQRLINGWARELQLEIPKVDFANPWQLDFLDSSHRKATGLTIIDIVREKNEADLCHSIKHYFTDKSSIKTIKEIDRNLLGLQSKSLKKLEQLACLNGSLIYTLFRIGLQKGITPPSDISFNNDDSSAAALFYADWIYNKKSQYFGYLCDPAREIILAIQYLNYFDNLTIKEAP